MSIFVVRFTNEFGEPEWIHPETISRVTPDVHGTSLWGPFGRLLVTELETEVLKRLGWKPTNRESL